MRPLHRESLGIDPCHIYHMCHIGTQNMIDMTSMIAIALSAFLRFEQPIQPQPACRLLLIFAPDLCRLYQQYIFACTVGLLVSASQFITCAIVTLH